MNIIYAVLLDTVLTIKLAKSSQGWDKRQYHISKLITNHVLQTKLITEIHCIVFPVSIIGISHLDVMYLSYSNYIPKMYFKNLMNMTLSFLFSGSVRRASLPKSNYTIVWEMSHV